MINTSQAFCFVEALMLCNVNNSQNMLYVYWRAIVGRYLNMFGYRSILKAPKHTIKKIFGVDVLGWGVSREKWPGHDKQRNGAQLVRETAEKLLHNAMFVPADGCKLSMIGDALKMQLLRTY